MKRRKSNPLTLPRWLPRGRVLLQKLIVTLLVKKFPAFYGTRRFITVCTTARHWSLSRPWLLSLCFPKVLITPRTSEWSLPFRYSAENLVYISHFSHACYMPNLSHHRWCIHPNNIRWSVQVMKLLIMQSSTASCPHLLLRSKYSPRHPVLKHPQPHIHTTLLVKFCCVVF